MQAIIRKSQTRFVIRKSDVVFVFLAVPGCDRSLFKLRDYYKVNFIIFIYLSLISVAPENLKNLMSRSLCFETAAVQGAALARV